MIQLYNSCSSQRIVTSFIPRPCRLSNRYLLNAMSVDVDERAALHFSLAVASFSGYVVESSWEGAPEKEREVKCQRTSATFYRFITTLFFLSKNSSDCYIFIIQWRRFLQKPGANFNSTAIRQWARRPLTGQDVFLVNRAYYDFGGYLEYTIRSAFEAVQEGWNSELVIDIYDP